MKQILVASMIAAFGVAGVSSLTIAKTTETAGVETSISLDAKAKCKTGYKWDKVKRKCVRRRGSH